MLRALLWFIAAIKYFAYLTLLVRFVSMACGRPLLMAPDAWAVDTALTVIAALLARSILKFFKRNDEYQDR